MRFDDFLNLLCRLGNSMSVGRSKHVSDVGAGSLRIPVWPLISLEQILVLARGGSAAAGAVPVDFILSSRSPYTYCIISCTD